MKRALFVLGAFGIAFMIGFCTTSCDIGNEYTDTDTLVCFGDSLTAGANATVIWREDELNSYPAFLQNKLKIPIVNAGVSGNTAGNGLARIRKDVIKKNPSIVIIQFGANDFFQHIDITTTRNNLNAIIFLLKNNNVKKIYLAKFYSETFIRDVLNSWGVSDYGEQTPIINAYDAMFNTLASSNNVTLIEDIWSGVWGTEHMSAPNDIHPKASGYQIMAENIFNAMKPYLQANNMLK